MNKVCTGLLLLILFSYNLPAQTATSVSSYPVIDLSALSPLGAVLSSSEASTRRTQMNSQTPSNDALLGVGIDVSGYNGTWNAKMSPKFQIMRSDLSSTSDWTTVWKSCKSYSGEGGGAGQWRLPTERELQMIWILHPQLRQISGFNAFAASTYYSATENSATDEWRVNFSNGQSSSPSYKKTATYARCVRDL